MPALVINQAYEPSGFVAAPSGGGSLTGTYYYRLAAVDSVGELLACGEAHTTVSSQGIKLDWDAMEGVSVFKLYRTNNAAGDDNDNDIWYSGSLLIKDNISGSATTYTDTGDSPSAGYCRRFKTDEDQSNPTVGLLEAPITETANVSEHEVPGRKGSVVEPMGYNNPIFAPVIIAKGTTAGTVVSIFQAIRSHGVAVKVAYEVAGQTWINDKYYYLENLIWGLVAGRASVSGGELIRLEVTLKMA